MTPIGKQIIVKPDTLPERDSNGIILPKNRVADTGVVVAVSKDHEFTVKEGDRIQFLPNTQEKLEDGCVVINGDDDTGNILFIFNE